MKTHAWPTPVLWPFFPPSIDWNMAQRKALDSRVTFTRASGATQTSAAGLVQSVAVNAPRFDHDPLTLASRGLLIEESRTNLVYPSIPTFTGSWAIVRASMAANATASPSGAADATKIVEDASVSTTHYIYVASGWVATAGSAYTFSGWFKKAEREYVSIMFSNVNGVGANDVVIVNLNNGAVTTTDADVTVSVTAYAGGWYRVAATRTALASAVARIDIRLSSSGVAGGETYTGTGAGGLYFWGAQISLGAFPTSYIPTTTASATRAADVATVTGAAFTSWFDPGAGTLIAEGIPARGGAAEEAFAGFNGAVGVRFTLNAARGGANRLGASLSVDPVGSIVSPHLYVAGSTIRMAASYGAGSVRLVINGADCGTLAGNIGTMDRLVLGNDSGGRPLNGTLARVRYWPRRLPLSVLQRLTA